MIKKIFILLYTKVYFCNHVETFPFDASAIPDIILQIFLYSPYSMTVQEFQTVVLSTLADIQSDV